MMRGPVWILGKGGMLGSHLVVALTEQGYTLWQPPYRQVLWNNAAQAFSQFCEAARTFAVDAALQKGWTVLWVAGVGTVGSDEASLASETTHFQALLTALEEEQGLWADGMKGHFFFASSAGAAYGDSTEILTEQSPAIPISPYGKTKILQEEFLHSWAVRHPQCSVLVGRISNLYGERQNMAKPQGIISHLCSSMVRQRTIEIYVPLDTIRDYLYVGDCTQMIVACLARIGEQAWMVKIFASETVTTLAELIGIVRRIAKRPPRIVTMPRSSAQQHVRSLRFRSIAAPDVRHCVQTGLPEGVHRVYSSMLERYAAGTL